MQRIIVNGETEEIPACDQYAIQGDLFLHFDTRQTIPVPGFGGREVLNAA